MSDPLRRLGDWLKAANYWLVGQTAVLLLKLLRLVPVDAALNFADRVARFIGPKVSRHRVALDNLRHAYPEKTEAEIAAIASDMWGNMAKLAVEYIFLDILFDHDRKTGKGNRIELHGIDILERTAAKTEPHIMFTGHLGNFELLAIAVTMYGLNTTILFRPPNNPYIAKYIFERRSAAITGLLASKKGAAFTLARIIAKGGNVGALVDQKFLNGIRTTFFGRECESSPLVPKLARQYGVDLHPMHCIRLPGNRYRLEMEEKLELPRDAEGRVDVEATAQLLNDVVERWVRRDPGQWMWFHKRWALSSGAKPAQDGEA